jgi:hypothetical protein
MKDGVFGLKASRIELIADHVAIMGRSDRC